MPRLLFDVMTGEYFTQQQGPAGEIQSDVPIEIPLAVRKRQKSLAERMRDMVRSELLSREAKAQGLETFEEADDFEVGEDYDPSSPYEEVFEPAPSPSPQPAPQAPAGGGEEVAPAPKE